MTVNKLVVPFRYDLEDLKLSPRSRLLMAHGLRICGWSPYPNHGGYRHWYCQRRRRHFGAHRFVNYVSGRIVRKQVHYKPTMRSTYAWQVLQALSEDKTGGALETAAHSMLEPRATEGERHDV